MCRIKVTLLFLWGLVLLGHFGVARAHYPLGVTYFAAGFSEERRPTFDGDLSDWAWVPEQSVWTFTEVLREKGMLDSLKQIPPEDFDAVVHLGWSPSLNMLLFAVRVTDDVLYAPYPELMYSWKEDNLQIYIDADHSGGDYRSPDTNSQGAQQNFFTPDEGIFDLFFTGRILEGTSLEMGTRWAYVEPYCHLGTKIDRTTGSYTFELGLAIWDHLDPRGPQASRRHILKQKDIIGFGCGIQDNDSEDDESRSAAFQLHYADPWADAGLFADLYTVPVEQTEAGPIPAVINVTLPDVRAKPGQDIVVPVEVDDATDIILARIVIVFDPTLLSFQDVESTHLTHGFRSGGKDHGINKLHVHLRGDKPIAGGQGAIVNIRFSVMSTQDIAPDSPSFCALTFEELVFWDKDGAVIPSKPHNGSFTLAPGLIGSVRLMMMRATQDVRAHPVRYVALLTFALLLLVILSIKKRFLIQRKIRALRREPFKPIPNPYIVGNPIRTREMFYGREDDFEYVRQKLESETRGVVIVFVGERRSGKTSILFQILNGELGDRFLPILIDMQYMVAMHSDREFYENIAIEACRTLGHPEIDIGHYDFDGKNPARVFEDLVDDILSLYGGKYILFLFDEYELLESKIEGGKLSRDVISFLASILESKGRVSFILTGSTKLEDRKSECWKVMIGKSLYRKISFLSKRDTIRLITEPVQHSVVYESGVPDFIYRLTAGQPFYSQVVCQNMVDRLNEVEGNYVQGDDLTQIIEDIVENPLPQMIHAWDRFSSEEKLVLSLLGELIKDEKARVSAKKVAKVIDKNRYPIELKEDTINAILEDLFHRDVLDKRRDSYWLRIDLLRHWVERAHSIWQVMGEAGISTRHWTG